MSLAAFVERTLARVRHTPVDMALLPSNVTGGTIFSGATGVAIFLVEMARLRGGDDELLERARTWLDAAEAWARQATPDDWKHLPRGFVFGQTGISYVDALLAAARGDRARAYAAVLQIERASERFDDLNVEVRSSGLIGGRAGVVVAARELLTRLPTHEDYEPARAVLQRVHDRVLASLLEVQASPFDPRPEALLGMGHGLAGELYVLASSGYADHPHVRARLGDLVGLRQVDPNGYAYWLFQRETDDASLIASWCNGSAGHLLLWTEIARLTRRDDAHELAADAARSTEFLMTADAGICCGLAGQSIALQRFADLSGEKRYARRAYARLARATEIAEADAARAFSYWQGSLGVAHVALARLRGERGFPCVDPVQRLSRA